MCRFPCFSEAVIGQMVVNFSRRLFQYFSSVHTQSLSLLWNRKGIKDKGIRETEITNLLEYNPCDLVKILGLYDHSRFQKRNSFSVSQYENLDLIQWQAKNDLLLYFLLSGCGVTNLLSYSSHVGSASHINSDSHFPPFEIKNQIQYV